MVSDLRKYFQAVVLWQLDVEKYEIGWLRKTTFTMEEGKCFHTISHNVHGGGDRTFLKGFQCEPLVLRIVLDNKYKTRFRLPQSTTGTSLQQVMNDCATNLSSTMMIF